MAPLIEIDPLLQDLGPHRKSDHHGGYEAQDVRLLKGPCRLENSLCGIENTLMSFDHNMPFRSPFHIHGVGNPRVSQDTVNGKIGIGNYRKQNTMLPIITLHLLNCVPNGYTEYLRLALQGSILLDSGQHIVQNRDVARARCAVRIEELDDKK